MDSYVEQFMAAGGSFVTLAKGNRGAEVRAACQKHGGFYLGSIGGPAARLAQDCIRQVETLAYPELGMEAIWRIEVEDFPAFIVIDDKGNDFFAKLAVRAMAVSSAFIDFVRDQLRPWGGGGIAARRMFGGAGLFRDGTMFALVHDDTLYFRTDAGNAADFVAAGMAPFSLRARRTPSGAGLSRRSRPT